MKTLRVAIIGLGAIHTKHLESVLDLKCAELVSVCDKDEEKINAFTEKYHVKGFTDYKELFKKTHPDVVHICRPHFLHKKVTLYALKKGASVVLEKPAALSKKDVKAIIEADLESPNELSIIMQNRFNRASIVLKETLEAGKLGKIVSADASVMWKRTKEYYSESDWRGTISGEGGGVIINQAIHTLDLLLWFVNKKVKSINATLKTLKHDIEVEDYAAGSLVFEGGIAGNFTFSNNEDDNYPVKIQLNCENGIAKMTGSHLEITYNDGDTVVVEETYDREGEKGYWGSSHSKQIANFYGYLIGEEDLFVKPEDVYYTHKIAFELLGRKK